MRGEVKPLSDHEGLGLQTRAGIRAVSEVPNKEFVGTCRTIIAMSLLFRDTDGWLERSSMRSSYAMANMPSMYVGNILYICGGHQDLTLGDLVQMKDGEAVSSGVVLPDTPRNE